MPARQRWSRAAIAASACRVAELGFTGVIGVRGVAKGEDAAKQLGGKVEATELDVAVPDATARAAAKADGAVEKCHKILSS
ncbi:hypothetical protein FJ987_17100 [Mesorhizobium sp. CU2]|uniref:hypothetical protein n=1 Tax=unclassified Mesorhizobium TaxID=325217 RepID=UPI001125E2A6|nr:MULTISPECIES: hypothetical protein [unclassified Mesorhizobium]TPN82002.1 hypothetical protein FJ988_17590 [Mesorhizobium sp. CU3]TPO12439.1 hypothetical protein FJ987_17100 [Mesorhizobium sp. CU2]